ncbi:MAG: serine/threonine-protein kinase [Kofleriaceae bacterium]
MVTRFGAYEILYELSSGGMGSVLLGRRRGPGTFEQLVAIKTILPIYAQTEAVRAMFLDEAALLARLSHPAIATVHDFGEDHGTLYMVMEYVAGIPFREVMAYGLPPAVAARAVAEACRGVHAAHELRDLAGHVLGVVHRDISPDNLMFGFDGHIKVIDFGIALVKNRQAPVTEFGTVKGKPPYMSPEQIKNEPIDRRSDVFSLAVVLWELLTGQGLFDGDSIYAIARAVEHQEIKPPSQILGAPLPLGLDAAVMNALDRDIAHRTPSAAALAEQLEEVIQTAGDETLEAWAARALEDPRLAHRAWLASVAAGKSAARPAGRATGAVTAIAPAVLGKAPTMIAPIAPAVPPTPAAPDDPQVSTHLAAHTGEHDDRRPRRSLALPILLAVIVLAMVGGIYLLRHASDVPVVRDAGVAPIDAHAIDAAPDAPPIDAPVDAIAAIDAGVPPIDAGHRRPIRPPVDAGRTVVHDAAPAAEPVVAGFGALVAKHKGDRYLNVVIDGRIIGPTPMFRQKIATGTHVVELVDAKTSEVVVKRTVKVELGATVSVVEP